MAPHYTIDDIKFTTDRRTFERAVGLYEGKKVTRVTTLHNGGCSARVMGTELYSTYVSCRNPSYGTCTCYLGENDILCKHMVALALFVVKRGEPLSAEDKHFISEPICSNKRGTLSAEELLEKKAAITAALRYIKPYNGPSSTWFAYQDSLIQGCARLAKIVSDLPVGPQTAALLVNLLLRLDRKISHHVDDSDGTVGTFMCATVEVLVCFTELDAACSKAFRVLKNKHTCFDWQEPLLSYINK